MEKMDLFMHSLNYDVTVIGAGPAGSATAYLLAKGGLRVALLDKFDFPRDKTCGDGLTPRALKMLDILGVLPQIESLSFQCSAITVRQSDAVTYRLDLDHLDGLPHRILISPRFLLDDALRQHAVEAGAEFRPNAKVEGMSRFEDGRVYVRTEDGLTIESVYAIIATGSNTKLLREVGLLKQPPPSNLAARAYFENVEGLDDTTLIFFDGVEWPGYGWVFPVAPGTANIGCGVFFDSPTPQSSKLRQLVQEHPYLRRILKNARQIGPVRGFPLRTDFSPSYSGNNLALVVGEALGLVNPMTGEGIDYALESAQLAAEAILNGWQGESATPATHRKYRYGLARRFSYLMTITHLAQRLYFRNGTFDKLLIRAQQRPHLRQAFTEACFGSARPSVMLTPRVLWEVFSR